MENFETNEAAPWDGEETKVASPKYDPAFITPALRTYAEQIGAVQTGSRKWIIKEMVEGYAEEVEALLISADGTLTRRTKKGAPVEIPADVVEAVKREWTESERPHSIGASKAGAHNFIDAELSDPDITVFIIYDRHPKVPNSDVAMIHVRRDHSTSASKSYHNYTLFSDGKWRELNPDGYLPIWKPETTRNKSRIMIHEGAKAARFCDELVNERAEALGDHPWGLNLEDYEHWGWLGGAPNPSATDWASIPRGVEIVIVPDNDKVGRDAVPLISKRLMRTARWLQFSGEFVKGFDLADPFPDSLFTLLDGRKVWQGPRLEDCLRPATWLTKIKPRPVDDDGKKKRGPIEYELTDGAGEQWIFVPQLERYVNYDHPHMRYKPETLKTILRKFADTNPVPLLETAMDMEVDSLCYRPDKPDTRIIQDHAEYKINTFRPSTLVPLKGDVKPFLDFMGRLIPDEKQCEFLMRFFATLTGRLDIRMKIAPLLISELQGTGKSTFAKIAGVLVGAHNTSEPTSHTVVESQFTDWIGEKRLVVVHEIYEGSNWQAYNKLKSKISEETIELHRKMEHRITIDNWATFILCSNSLNALRIEDQERRLFIPQVTEDPWPKEKAQEFYAWLNSGGYRIIHNWALTRDKDFYLPNHCEAINTELKELIAEASVPPIIAYVDAMAGYFAELGVAVPSRTPPITALAISPADMSENAQKRYPKYGAQSLETIKRRMMDAGLQYLQTRLKIDGRKQRVCLNAAAITEIETQAECKYQEKEQQFFDAATGKPVGVEKISSVVRDLISATKWYDSEKGVFKGTF